MAGIEGKGSMIAPGDCDRLNPRPFPCKGAWLRRSGNGHPGALETTSAKTTSGETVFSDAAQEAVARSFAEPVWCRRSDCEESHDDSTMYCRGLCEPRGERSGFVRDAA